MPHRNIVSIIPRAADLPVAPPDFSEYPQSIADFKSERSGDGSDWSPRDVLVDVLRQIDKGEIKPDSLICIYRHPNAKNINVTGYSCSSQDGHVTLGMLQVISNLICQGCSNFFRASGTVLAGVGFVEFTLTPVPAQIVQMIL